MKNNYNECLTNLACSVQKYFGLAPKHNTLPFLDEILEREKPKKVVLVLLDGMGANILERTLPENSFFRQNLVRNLTSVFPATTTAATTSVRTGLNPVEHGWLGWNMYIKPIDKIITLFLNSEKGKDGEICEDFLGVKDKLVSNTIVDEMNENGNCAAEFFPFGENAYKNLDDMIEKVKASSSQYVYAYDDEPDHTMHDFGPDDNRVKDLILERNDKIEKLCSELKDTLVIVTADHGHLKIEHVFLKNYPEFLDLLERTTSLEQRAVSFKVKSGKNAEFEKAFSELFGKDFRLYKKSEVIESGLFGDGNPNEFFEDAIGDYLAVAENSNKALVAEGEEVLVSHHAGCSDDEVLVPLIVKMCK